MDKAVILYSGLNYANYFMRLIVALGADPYARYLVGLGLTTGAQLVKYAVYTCASATLSATMRIARKCAVGRAKHRRRPLCADIPADMNSFPIGIVGSVKTIPSNTAIMTQKKITDEWVLV